MAKLATKREVNKLIKLEHENVEKERALRGDLTFEANEKSGLMPEEVWLKGKDKTTKTPKKK